MRIDTATRVREGIMKKSLGTSVERGVVSATPLTIHKDDDEKSAVPRL